MKINIGIVGYGNLGKSVEQIILTKPNLNLVAIFSRRVIKSKFNTLVDSYDNISFYKDKIDILLLCGGSFGDLESQTTDLILNFDCINTFDNHKKIYSEYKRLNYLATKSKHRLIMSVGWDPGLFSNIRAICYSLSFNTPITFWGKGISMGHSEAIRNLKNVKDAVEFTIPNNEYKKLAKLKKLNGEEQLHYRECYVVAEKKFHKQIEKQIKNIPNYFKGQQIKINFVSSKKLLTLRSKLSHKGEIISKFKTIQGSNCLLEFKLKTQSNPDLTASVMVSYVNAIINLKANNQSGAFTSLDIPISYLFNQNQKEKLINLLC